ncbi:MAG: sulfatase-like hydrolase/transferase [Arenibacter sp.]|nr:sulfatase-like hydrolase/transferase [Arenibacter sp.]
MSRILFFLLLATGLLHLTSCKNSVKATGKKKPNIILIMADDLGIETLGSYGGSSYRTPHLDQLAKGGMRFTHCYATPLCTPSRVQIMTGKYSFRNYIGFGLLDPEEKTFGHYMQEAGYATYIAGKWQLLGNTRQQQLAGNRIGTWPEKAGFDDYCLWQIDKLGSRYKDPTLSSKKDGTKAYPGEYGPDIFLKNISNFMEKHKESPFFIYYPMVLTHDPFVPTPKNKKFPEFDPSAKVNDPAYFGEMVQYMDSLVGQIVKKTEELGILENTVILFVGDNGTDRDVVSTLNGHPLRGDKGHTTDAGTHVPLIVHWKGKVAPKSTNNNLIDFTDFLPTLLGIAGTKESPNMSLDGLSFYPQLLGDNTVKRDWVFCHYEPNWGKFKNSRYVQNKSWKLYDNGELYNLDRDIVEKNPIQPNNYPKEQQALIKTFKEVLNQYN